MKKYIIATMMLLLTVAVNAQLAEDALRYSQSFYQGTARSMGAGGAFSAVGADFSTASTNPAGLGLFRTYDMTITPEVFSRKAASTYNGTYAEDSRTIFDLSNIGYVMTTPLSNGQGWKYVQFALGMNRLNNYNSVVNMQGVNNENSKLDVYWEQADVPYYNLESEDPFYLEPAWAVLLLDTVPGFDDLYYTPVPNSGVFQQQRVISKGSTNEWLFSLAGNYNDFLFLGATVGLPYIRYDRKTYYSEEFTSDNVPDFQRWSVTENLITTGWGINLKLGAILKPTDWVRIGAAFHTPSYYWNMTDTWNTVTTSTEGGRTYEATSLVTGNYSYRFYTPLKAIGSMAFFINQMGFISAEYEYADYSTSKFGSKAGLSSDVVNTSIRDSYQSTNNLRFGTEWRLGMISLRGGYGFSTSPYKDNLNDGKRTSYSGGIGYKKDGFALDFAYVYSVMNEDYYLYSYENQNGLIQTNPVNNKYTTNQFALTFRFNF